MRLTVFSALLVLILSCVVWAGDLWPAFQVVSPSLRAAAMGSAGAAVPDQAAIFHNPAAIGFVDGQRFGFAFSPIGSNGGNLPGPSGFLRSLSSQSMFGTVFGVDAPRSGGYTLATGLYRVTADGSSGEEYRYPSLEWGNPVIPSHTIFLGDVSDNVSENFVLGLTRYGKVSWGLGATVKRVVLDRPWYIGESSSGTTRIFRRGRGHRVWFDVGAIGQIESPRRTGGVEGSRHGWVSALTLGFAVKDVGSRFNIPSTSYGYLSDWQLSREPSYETEGPDDVPTVAGGVSWESAWYSSSQFRDWKIFALVITMELKNTQPSDDRVARFGFEMGVGDMLYARSGAAIERHGRYYWEHQTRPALSWGFGIRSRGLLRAAQTIYFPNSQFSHGSLGRFLTERLDVEFLFARNTYQLPKVSQFGFAVSYR